MASENLTITLTNRAPVSIVKADWPVIASAKAYDSEHESQANRTWRLTVRQHEDGRAIVYGVYDTSFRGERDSRAGKLCAAGEDLAAAINAVARDCGCEAIAAACIADLPAEQLT